jgi:hypothetical protein
LRHFGAPHQVHVHLQYIGRFPHSVHFRSPSFPMIR